MSHNTSQILRKSNRPSHSHWGPIHLSAYYKPRRRWLFLRLFFSAYPISLLPYIYRLFPYLDPILLPLSPILSIFKFFSPIFSISPSYLPPLPKPLSLNPTPYTIVLKLLRSLLYIRWARTLFFIRSFGVFCLHLIAFRASRSHATAGSLRSLGSSLRPFGACSYLFMAFGQKTLGLTKAFNLVYIL